ncbi:hypothetical protein DFH11DRAFT_1551116 [Phellopilus nigrolimitatus]|nr:hypothetical protein DFH11DRAFT_1551116 [Phellopilus nigrolimitatus]
MQTHTSKIWQAGCDGRESQVEIGVECLLHEQENSIKSAAKDANRKVYVHSERNRETLLLPRIIVGEGEARVSRRLVARPYTLVLIVNGRTGEGMHRKDLLVGTVGKQNNTEHDALTQTHRVPMFIFIPELLSTYNSSLGHRTEPEQVLGQGENECDSRFGAYAMVNTESGATTSQLCRSICHIYLQSDLEKWFAGVSAKVICKKVFAENELRKSLQSYLQKF